MEGMDMNFSLEGLDELIESAEKMKESQKDQKMANFTAIIKGVARKYASKWVEREDLENDLWVRVLELIKDCGGVENTDEDLVARVAFNKAVDKYRYHRRRYDSKAEYIEASNVDDKKDIGTDYFEALHSEKFLRGYDLVLIKEVIDLFEIGSKERKYAILKIVNAGLVSAEDLDPWDKAIVEIPETEDEEGYIHCLGYTSHAPGSWIGKKRIMKARVIEFLQ